MLSGFAASADHIILACGATDFRKQIEGLSSLVSMKYKLEPFASGYVFIFCNKRRNYIWELCMLSPNEYYKFVTTGVYPLSIANPPRVPQVLKAPSELGTKQGNND